MFQAFCLLHFGVTNPWNRENSERFRDNNKKMHALKAIFSLVLNSMEGTDKNESMLLNWFLIKLIYTNTAAAELKSTMKV